MCDGKFVKALWNRDYRPSRSVGDDMGMQDGDWRSAPEKGALLVSHESPDFKRGEGPTGHICHDMTVSHRSLSAVRAVAIAGRIHEGIENTPFSCRAGPFRPPR